MVRTCQLFPLGRIVATPGAIKMLNKHGQDAVSKLIRMHHCGQWGDLDNEDKACNDRAVKSGARILSAYKLGAADKLWIITEHDRSATTLLLPEEY